MESVMAFRARIPSLSKERVILVKRVIPSIMGKWANALGHPATNAGLFGPTPSESSKRAIAGVEMAIFWCRVEERTNRSKNFLLLISLLTCLRHSLPRSKRRRAREFTARHGAVRKGLRRVAELGEHVLLGVELVPALDCFTRRAEDERGRTVETLEADSLNVLAAESASVSALP